MKLTDDERQQLIDYIREAGHDIDIARRLGNTGIADNLEKARDQAMKDLRSDNYLRMTSHISKRTIGQPALDLD